MSEISLYVYKRKKQIADLMKIGVSAGSIAEHLGIPEVQVRQEYKEYLDDLKGHIKMSADQARVACTQKLEYIEEKTVKAGDEGSIAALNLQLKIAMVKVRLFADPTEESAAPLSVSMPPILEDIDNFMPSQYTPQTQNKPHVEALKIQELKQLYISSIGFAAQED